MKKSELREIIREIVRREFRESIKEHLNVHIPLVLGETLVDLVDRRVKTAIKEHVGVSTKNRNSLREEFDVGEEWPTLGGGTETTSRSPVMDRSKLAAMLGYDQSLSSPSHGNINRVAEIVTDSGVVKPLDPNATPEYLLKAMNRDYSTLLKKMNEKSSMTRGA